MKKLIILFSVALCQYSFAQTATVTSDETGYQLIQNDVLHYWIPATNGPYLYHDERDFSVNLNNTVADSFQIRRTILAHADPGADVYFCTDFECTGIGDNVCSPFFVGAAARIGLALHYKTNSVPGVTTVLYSIYSFDNPSDSFYFTVHYHVTTGAVGIAETSSITTLSAPMPNPSSASCAIAYNTGTQAAGVFNMYNALGELVSATTLSAPQGIHVANTATLPEGVYICTLVSEGKIIGTRRIAVVH
ncbi:MAG: T9SS type A sorting domain-containing protein [Bacteroidetes bacterium]|nr:T9SS type A sorting domain-containing protein [Bacteroidota bacterium]